jgi:hypothetical protein
VGRERPPSRPGVSPAPLVERATFDPPTRYTYRPDLSADRCHRRRPEIGASVAPSQLVSRYRSDGSGRVKMDAGRLRTRGHIDVGHRPEVPLEDRANVA